jgi:lysozyme
MVPTLAVAGFIVLLAFVLGRASAGGGGEAAVQATATAKATTTTTTRDTTHTVAQGESLLAIASRYGLTLDQLAAANGISNANKVFVGQVLKIPTPFPSASTTLPASTTTTTTTKKTTKTP